MIKLLSTQLGAMFLGEMVGCQGSGKRGEGEDVKFWKKGEERKQFLHDEDSFKAMWDEVAEMTSTVGMWKVESKLKLREKEGMGREAGDVRSSSEKVLYG